MKYNIKFELETRKVNPSNKKAPLAERIKNDSPFISGSIPIRAVITFAGQRLFFLTGYRVDIDWNQPDQSAWSFEEGKLKRGKTAKEGKQPVKYSDVNARLDLIRGELAKLFSGSPTKAEVITKLNEVCGKGKKPKSSEMEFYPMFERYVKEARLSGERREHVAATIAMWRRFNDKLRLIDIDSDTLKAFERHLLSEKRTIKKTNIKKNVRGINRVHSIMNITRAFWNNCRDEFREKGKRLHYPFDNYTIPAEVYTRPIYITKEERDDLFKANLTSKRLRQVRDIFVFQCLIGARVGDMVKLTKDNISNDILSYIPRKTKDDKPVVVTVPLSAKAKEILSRYDLPDGRLLPFITDQRYNDYIKELFEEVGLVRLVTRLNPTTRREEQVRLCDIASSHMGRRAFIGNLYGKVDNGIICSMSGHVEGSKAFSRYHDVSEELKKQAINLID